MALFPKHLPLFSSSVVYDRGTYPRDSLVVVIVKGYGTTLLLDFILMKIKSWVPTSSPKCVLGCQPLSELKMLIEKNCLDLTFFRYGLGT